MKLLRNHSKEVIFLDKESILRLELDHVKNIDCDRSIESYDPTTNNHIIFLKLKKDVHYICPHCGTIDIHKPRSTVLQTIKHASSTEDNIIIKFKRRVLLCSCGHSFREPNPFNTSKKRISYHKECKILFALKDINKSYKDVADEFNTSPTTVTRIFDSKVNIPRQHLTEVLSVDEVYSKHCGFHKYCFIIYSPQQDKILDVLPSRHKEYLIDYFSKIPRNERKKVKYFSIDLYEVYRQVAKKCFPNALICADHFHVIKNLSTFFNTARIRIMKKYEYLKPTDDNFYWLYKKYWKLLLKNPDKLGYKKFKVARSRMHMDEHQIVDYMLFIDPQLKAAYELMNEYKNFNATATIEDAEERLDELMNKFLNSPLTEFHKFYRLLKNWRQEIINSFNKVNGYIISNGGMERANRDIKTIIRHAFGYRNFRRLRNRIMYIKNKDTAIKI